MTTPAADERETALWRALTLMGRRLQGILEQRLQASVGISVPDFEILSALARSEDGRMRAGELGEMLGWEKSRTSHHVSRMEARDLVSRVTCHEDLRGTWVEIRSQGRLKAAAAQRVHADAVRAALTDILEPEETDALARTAMRVLDGNPLSTCRVEIDRLAVSLGVAQPTAR
ncbi:MarR family winged helix-turn-helix transcriptional regulator [Demequina sp. SYSU T00039]|uniref:MarR family winged helix-turn-helix transcriptional regulator n=1 Tax=Demequina lignilytica TaxID=3051663 RepID=A0AAW7M2Q0_9MICO|nr:MarR family winged helix-turn-helix transcriptional regulator [Demequina sp. SYSU T00039]MDN4486653.1 MarR family winged helix-turn-helix transcriptional regulator [Demequina sp. SYSU T00039]